MSRPRHTTTSGEFKPLPDTAQCCIGRNKACISNQVTIRAPRRRHPHRAASPATSPSPRPSSASALAGRTSGTPGPPRSATSTRTAPARDVTVTVTVSPGTPEPPCWRLLAKSSLARSTASSPQGCPGPRTAPTNARTTRARSTSPATFTLSRTVAPVISPPPSRPPGKTRRGRTDAREIHAHLCGHRQAEYVPRAPGSLPAQRQPGAPAVSRTADENWVSQARSRIPSWKPARRRISITEMFTRHSIT